MKEVVLYKEVELIRLLSIFYLIHQTIKTKVLKTFWSQTNLLLDNLRLLVLDT